MVGPNALRYMKGLNLISMLLLEMAHSKVTYQFSKEVGKNSLFE